MKKYSLLLLLAMGCGESKTEDKVINLDDISVKVDSCILKSGSIQGSEGILSYAERTELLLYAKAAPVFFERKPEFSPSNSKRVNKLRKAISESENPWAIIDKLTPELKYKQKENREIFLKEGYLYTDNKHEAYALAQLMKPDYLFSEPKFYVTRGSITMEASKKKAGYFYSDGPLKGQRVTVILFDLLTLESPKEFLHIDLQSIKLSLGAEKVFPASINKDYVVANVFYETSTLLYVFKRDGAKLSVDCHDKMTFTKTDYSGLQNLKTGILGLVDERMPFDEPIHEYGLQLDGRLRPKWKAAYRNKKTYFVYNGDKYYVFDSKGNPNVPEVCVDFLVDAMDRSAGTWFQPKGEKPKRSVGTFDSTVYESDFALRNVNGFTSFVQSNPSWFEVTTYNDKIELSSKDFYKSIVKKDLLPGDIVFIKGKTPWDPNEEHSHSFFIFENDPISGLPITVAGNAGPASLRPWEIERKRTPQRYIFMKVRPKPEFLNILSKDKNIETGTLIIR